MDVHVNALFTSVVYVGGWYFAGIGSSIGFMHTFPKHYNLNKLAFTSQLILIVGQCCMG